ncbi:MAG TPA: hypothetical protein VMU08_07770 [Rhizomicrobium sp.]|nr:hypothetical protein [Rhizomicrobium sp.]
MKRAFVLGAVVALAFAAPAFADEDVMASRYGNTTDSVDSQGIHTKLYYSADHTFKADVGGMQVHGTWKADGGTICLTFVDPPANLPSTMPNPTCLPVVAHKVGDTWTTGEGPMKRTVSLKAGIQ